jgi:hypothetical protein
VKGGISKKDGGDRSQLPARRSTAGTIGFLFLTWRNPRRPCRNNIDIPGIADAKGGLMYFEIPVDNYLNAPKNP